MNQRVRSVPLVARLAVGLASIALCAVLIPNASAILELRRNGDFIGANATSGLTEEALGRLLGQVQLILIGGGLAAIASTARSFRRLAPRLSWVISEPAVALTILAIAIGGITTLGRSFVYHGETHFSLRDDAMIAMRYAKNVAMGIGPVYDAGERVEGYTGPLWVLVLAVVHLAHPSVAIAPLLALVLTWASVVGTLWALQAMMKSYGASGAWIALAGAALALDADTIVWAFTGLETPALTAAVTVAGAALARGRPRTFAAALALVPVLRSDAAVIAVPLAALFVALAPNRSRALTLVLFAAVPTAAHIAFRVAYYHSALPNTYYLKILSLPDGLVAGVGGFGLRVLYLHGALVLTAIGALSSRKAPPWLRGLVAIALVQIAYGVRVGGDSFQFSRFFAPVLPLIFAASAWTLRSLTRKSQHALRVPVVAAFAFLVPTYSPTGTLGGAPLDPTFLVGSLASAELLHANVPRSALITASYAGTTPYYDIEHSFIDTLGKSDAHIAHLPHYFGLAIGHNKFDFDYVYDRRKPAVVHLEHDCENVERIARMSESEIGRRVSELPRSVSPFGIYERAHPTFLKRYLPNPVHLVGRMYARPFGCFFIREDADLSTFWSKDGPPPRLPSARIEFDRGELDDRVAFDDTWGAVEVDADGRRARHISSRGASSIDLWLDVGTDLSVEVCRAGAGSVDVQVNDVPVPLSYEGGCGRGVIAQNALAKRRASTRLTLRGSDLGVYSVTLKPLGSPRPE